MFIYSCIVSKRIQCRELSRMFFFYMICTRQYSVMVFPMAFTSLKKSFKMDNGVKIHIK